MILLKIIRYIGVSLWLLSILVLYFKGVKIYVQFRDYFFEIKDFDILQLMGGIDIDKMNNDIKKTIGRGPFFELHRRLLERYNQTGDEQYLMFDKYCRRQAFVFTIIFFAGFIFYILTVFLEEFI